jgi:cytochrome c5
MWYCHDGIVIMPDKSPRSRLSFVGLIAVGVLVTQGYSAQASDRSGKEVVDKVCASCHATGAKGAPKMGDKKAWAPLASKGLTSLTESALKGVRSMPAHGGDLALSDIEIERAIIYMVNQSGGRWVEPVSGVSPAVERRGKQVVEARCGECHGSGKDGAPRIGEQAAWIPRLKHGVDFLVRSAINGHGAMPPRGGMADLTDSEIRGAIIYMLNPAAVTERGAATAALPKVPSSNRKIVGNTEIYFGIVSAETLRAQHKKPDKESAMHGGIPSGKDYYHINVSLFDAKTRQSITGAQVEARFNDPMSGQQSKKLEPVTFNGVQSYGNYFRMPAGNNYTITVRVQRPGTPGSTAAEFQFKPR